MTRCAAVETSSVQGFASNQGPRPLRLRGEIRFRFTSAGAPSRPDQLVQADVELPSGKAVQVARLEIAPPLREGEQCGIDVSGALFGAP
ncbi:MAG TPA: hypothetical protein VN915_04235 [Elusimicrobiota bacterium]|nr:hypothetical protein [Elusimicrobiota bacterium]